MVRVFITGFILLFVATYHGVSRPCGVSLSCPETQSADTTTVATVNGEDVTLREFMLHARTLRPLVIRDFRTRFGAEYNSGFWTRKFDGSTPGEVLKTMTMDTMIRVKIQQLSAMRAGLVSDISYQGFLAALEKENVRRLAAKQSGKVIYGPVQYSEEVYYNYLFSNMVAGLKEYLAESVFNITEARLKEDFEKEKDSLYQMGYYTEVHLTRLEQDTGKVSKGQDMKMKNDQNTLIFNDSVYVPEEENELWSMVRQESGKLKMGQSCKVFEADGAGYLVQVIEKKPLGSRSYESSRTRVRLLFVNRLYDNYIRVLVQQAALEINQDTYTSINFWR